MLCIDVFFIMIINLPVSANAERSGLASLLHEDDDSQMTVDYSNVSQPLRLSQRVKKERHFGEFIRSDQLSVTDSSSSVNTANAEPSDEPPEPNDVQQSNLQVLYNGEVTVDMTPALAQGKMISIDLVTQI